MPICTGCLDVPGGFDDHNQKCQDCIKKEEEQQANKQFLDQVILTVEIAREAEKKRSKKQERETYDFGPER